MAKALDIKMNKNLMTEFGNEPAQCTHLGAPESFDGIIKELKINILTIHVHSS